MPPFDPTQSLTPASLAALMPPEIQALLRTPGINPDAQDTPPGGVYLDPNTLPGATMDENRPSLESILPLLAGRARQIAQSVMGPDPSTMAAPAQRPGFLQTLLAAIPQAIQVGISDNPGQALEGVIRNREALRLRQADQQRADQAERRRTEQSLTAQILTTQMNQDITDRREDRKDARDAERERTRFMEAQRRILGDQAFELKKAELNNLYEETKRAEMERAADERQATAIKAQQSQKARDLTKEYRLQGAGKYAKELADYDAGLTDSISPQAEQALQVVTAKIQRMQALAARAAAGGTAKEPKPGDIPVEVLDRSGKVIGRGKYSDFKYSETGVQGFPIGTTVRIMQPATGVGGASGMGPTGGAAPPPPPPPIKSARDVQTPNLKRLVEYMDQSGMQQSDIFFGLGDLKKKYPDRNSQLIIDAVIRWYGDSKRRAASAAASATAPPVQRSGFNQPGGLVK